MFIPGSIARRTARTLALAAMLAGAGAASAQAASPAQTGGPVKSDVSPPLRSIKPRAPTNGHAFPARRRTSRTGTAFDVTPGDLHQQVAAGAGPAISSPSTFEGVSNLNAVVPPDTNGDVGLRDYVQWVNLSFEIFSKSGAVRYGPAAGNTLWSGFGGACDTTNEGDPIVLYDRQADRWLFSQFAFTTRHGSPVAPYLQCIAISTTGDPTGSYYRYAFLVNGTADLFPDYPKFGIWPDGYYMSTNNFSGNTLVGAGVYAFDRTKMLNGDPTAGFVSFQLDPQFTSLLPSNLVGATPPPGGSPNYFGAVDTAGTGTGSTFQIWKFHADFATPANSTFAGPTNVPVSPYTYSFCGQAFSESCIAQPGTSNKVDPLADRLMNRLDYRNFGDHESLVANHTVDVGSNRAGVRWYEIRAPGSATPNLFQQGTYAPADGVSRWMGSAAMDGDGDLALGYSVSNATSVFPGIRVVGRLASDPLGTLPQAEQTLQAGAGSQTGTNRWGDYSAMSVDPVDDSTFWYTQEYYPSSSSASWHTRIGSFRLRAAPPVTVTSPTQGSATTSSPTFQGTASTAAGDSSTVTVKVYSGTALFGTPIETLSTTRDPSTGAWSVAASPPLGEGTYTVQAQQLGSGGNTGYSNANSFTVDATPPVVTLTTPAGGALTNDSTPTFQGTAGTLAGDSSTVTVKVYSGSSVAGSPVQTLSTTRAANGSWSVTASPALADGTYTAQARQSDAAGNVGTSSPVTFTIDATPPAISLTSPAAGSFTNDTTPTFQGTAGTASGDSGSVTVKVYSGTTATGSPVETLAATRQPDGSFSVTASPALANGTYTAQAQQSDAAGNVGSSNTRTFTIDTTPPVVAISSPTAGSATNDTTPTFQGTAGIAAGDSTTVTVNVYSGTLVSGSPVEALVATRAANGSWSVTASPALAQGTYTAQAQQSDAAGNTGSSPAVTFTIDTTAPSISLTSPAGGTLTNDSTPTFQGTAGTASGDSTTVTVKVYSGASASGTPVQTLPTTRGGGGAWSVTASPALADGTYTAQAEQTDTAGNTGSSSPVTFTVDTTAPVVAVTSPAAGSSTNDTTPTLQGTAGLAAGDSASVTVNIYVGSSASGSPVETLGATRQPDGSWAVAASPALAEGTYTVQAQQSDGAGNSATSNARTFTIDTTAPVVTLTSPVNGDFTGATPTFQGSAGSASGDSSTVTVRVYAGGAASGSPVETLFATRQATGSWSVTASPALTTGTYTVQAEQPDAAGNVGKSGAATFSATGAPNVPPTAAFSFAPSSPLPGEAVAFDGTASSDPDGKIASWLWGFGDGASATGATPSHAYAAAGGYTVQLTVTDDHGSTGATASPLTVQAPPALPATPPTTPATPPAGPAPSPTAPRISLRLPKRRLGTVIAHGLAGFVTSDQTAIARLRLLLTRRTAKRLGIASVTIARTSKRIATPDLPVKVVVRLSSKARRALAHVRRVTVTITLHVTDAAGLATDLRQKLVLRR